MKHLAAERIDHTNVAVDVRSRKRMRAVITREILVNDDALVNQVDPKIAPAKFTVFVFEIIRRTNYRWDSVSDKIIAQQFEFTCCRKIDPIHNGYVGHVSPTPFAICFKQRVEQAVNRSELAKSI